MEFDLKRLTSQLREAKESRPELTPISEYVRTAILEPMLAGQEVLFAELNFSQFDETDIQTLEDRLSEQKAIKSELASLNGSFCAAQPVCRKHRAFC